MGLAGTTKPQIFKENLLYIEASYSVTTGKHLQCPHTRFGTVAHSHGQSFSPDGVLYWLRVICLTNPKEQVISFKYHIFGL